MKLVANYRTAPSLAVVSRLHIERHWRSVGDPDCYARKGFE